MIIEREPAYIRIELSYSERQSEVNQPPFRPQRHVQSLQAHPNIPNIHHPQLFPGKSDLIFQISKNHDEISELVRHIILTYWSRHQQFMFYDTLTRTVKDISYRIDSIQQAFKVESFQQEVMEGTKKETQELFRGIKVYQNGKFALQNNIGIDLIFKQSFQEQIIEPYQQHLHKMQQSYDKSGMYANQGEHHRGTIGLERIDDDNDGQQETYWPSMNQMQNNVSVDSQSQVEYANPSDDDQDNKPVRDPNIIQSIYADLQANRGLDIQKVIDMEERLTILRLNNWRRARLQIFQVVSFEDEVLVATIQ